MYIRQRQKLEKILKLSFMLSRICIILNDNDTVNQKENP
jgi:hypothetical protein